MTPSDYLESNHADAVASLCDFLRIESISTQPDHADDVSRAAEWVAEYLRSMDLDVAILPTEGHPVVFGQTPPVKGPTVLIYGHYDVQPEGDLDRWTTQPFVPTIRDGLIFARGVADNKGQIFAQMLGVEASLRTKRSLRVNVKFVIEGEEEVGSPNLPALLERESERLACDVVVISDTPLYKSGQPALSYGVRGVLGLELKVTGPRQDLHSGIYGGSVPNPIAVLCRMLAALHDDKGRVTVPGYYDAVRPIPDVERAAWAALEFDDAAYSERLGCGLAGEEGYSTLERRWGRPTLEFNGITGGYQGPGSNTIVPEWARCKITGRLVPDQDPSALTGALVAHLKSLAPPGVTLEFTPRRVGARGYAVDPEHPGLEAAAAAFSTIYGVEPVRVREGLSLPILSAFKSILGADTILLGFCDPDCGAHSHDEFFGARDLLLGACTAAEFLKRYGESRHNA